jgi:hypothetical protein
MKAISEAENEVDEHLFMAKKLTYIFEVLEQKGKERVEDGGVDIESSQSSQYTIDPSEEDLERISVPGDIDKMQSPDYYKTRVERAEERIEEEKVRRLNSSKDDYASALDKYVRAKEIYYAKRNQIKEIQTSSMSMKEDMALRKARWRQFRDFISEYSGIKFDQTRTYFGLGLCCW